MVEKNNQISKLNIGLYVDYLEQALTTMRLTITKSLT